MGVLISGFQEEQRQAMMRIGIALIVGFIFPIYVFGYPSGKLVFANIELIGRSDFFTILGLLYPLAAGMIVLWVRHNLETISRPVILLVVGFLPIVFGFLNRKDFVAGSIREYNSDVAIVYLIILALIGVYVGSRIVAVTEHVSGRLIGGISGLIFMLLVLLPVTKGGTPIYFSLFTMFRSGVRSALPGSVIFFGITFIIIFTCYLFASLIAVLNFSYRPSSDRTATNSYRLVFLATLAIPASILLAVLFTGGSGAGAVKGTVFTLLVKVTLLLGGFISAISTGLWDLADQLLPRTVTGGDLFNNRDQVPAGPPEGYK